MKRSEIKDKSFENLGISPGLLLRIKKLGFDHPTPIQFKTIPVANSGEDVIGIAQTGSGKTLAFSVPMLQRIAATNRMGLVLVPTRELAVQVEETLHKIASGSGLKTALVIGGTNPFHQVKKLKASPHVIVATPGRLIDHMDQKNINLQNVGTLILDEADRMLDMGFTPQLNKILRGMTSNRQTMLFSATMPDEIAKIASTYMKSPTRVEVAPPGTTVKNIDQEVILVHKDQKMELLQKLLRTHEGKILVFSRTKYGAKKIARLLRDARITADEMHSDRSQAQRQRALKDFATGKLRVLVATDIAARGIDVSDIRLVINFDLPEQLEDYVHRIGRTGRAGKSGKAISFVMPDQKRDLAQIERLIKMPLPMTSMTGERVARAEHSQSDKHRPHRNSGGPRRSNNRHRSNRSHSRSHSRRRFDK